MSKARAQERTATRTTKHFILTVGGRGEWDTDLISIMVSLWELTGVQSMNDGMITTYTCTWHGWIV